ncbi:hypothetical protein [Helicobacter cetorum]|uniref:hypothetical protein n=1 Tax=Helicobacter cetorum TaxID=138563 RepID=UPI000CF103A2|nr:hypothetical protein [Helicobacter cetorum]
MHDLVLKSQALGFQTRLVQCDLAFAYEEFIPKSERSFELLEEYERLDLGFDFSNLNIQSDTLELLKAMYSKLEKLESLLLSQNLLKLERSSSILALGHGLICARDESFIVSKNYYVRCLFLGKFLAFFGIAKDESFLEITRMRSLDIKRYDKHIANAERLKL